ncbi:MAG: hypothetical protein GY745_22020 [Actinomycetia bacterium]|nr:hypothetical protein [Actinomycetes bacterium]MCP4087697.1 hypothetical protein [Actinomycetes bacterium]
MRIAVETWSPEYGTPTDEAALADTEVVVDAGREVDPGHWDPIRPEPAHRVGVCFIDGVRRVDARVWVTDDQGLTHQGICASYAAGVVQAGDRARVVRAEVRRRLFCPVPGPEGLRTRYGWFEPQGSSATDPDGLSLALQHAMGSLEAELAADDRADDDLLVVDGPLRLSPPVPGAIGYIKTHQRSYLPDEVGGIIARLGVAERTPLVFVSAPRPRWTWYFRLPVEPEHPWAGVVRCELEGTEPLASAATGANQITTLLPRYATRPHEDARAPQNLHPIAGLERELRRRMGDPALIWRGLRLAAAAGG